LDRVNLDRLRCLVAALGCAAALSGCGSVTENMSTKMSELPGVGLPANAPERPATPTAYPAVHDVPPQRPAPLLNESQRAQMESELVSARNRQQAVTGTASQESKDREAKEPETRGAAKKEPAKKKKTAPNRASSPQAVTAPSGRTIY
jgi:hypothetical protein